MLPPCFWAPPYVVCNKITKTATADPSPRRLNLRPSLPSRPTNKCRWVGHRVGRARNAGKARPDRPRKAGTASRRDTHTWRGRRSSQGCPACAATSSYGRRCYAQRSLVHLTAPPLSLPVAWPNPLTSVSSRSPHATPPPLPPVTRFSPRGYYCTATLYDLNTNSRFNLLTVILNTFAPRIPIPFPALASTSVVSSFTLPCASFFSFPFFSLIL